LHQIRCATVGDAESLTPRLRFRRPLDFDEPAYLALLLKPAVSARLRPPQLEPFTAPQVQKMLSEDIDHWCQGRLKTHPPAPVEYSPTPRALRAVEGEAPPAELSP